MKKILIILFIGIMIIGVTGCGNKKESYNNESNSEKSKTEVIEKEKKEEIKEKEVKKGDTIETDFATMSLDDIRIEDEIYPDDTSSTYLYITDEEGKKYISIRGKIKNLYTENIAADYVGVKLVINDKYSYTGEMIIPANPQSTTDFALEPLGTSTFIIYANAPDEAINSMTSAKFIFGFNENFDYMSNYKDAKYKYSLNFTK